MRSHISILEAKNERRFGLQSSGLLSKLIEVRLTARQLLHRTPARCCVPLVPGLHVVRPVLGRTSSAAASSPAARMASTATATMTCQSLNRGRRMACLLDRVMHSVKPLLREMVAISAQQKTESIVSSSPIRPEHGPPRPTRHQAIRSHHPRATAPGRTERTDPAEEIGGRARHPPTPIDGRRI